MPDPMYLEWFVGIMFVIAVPLDIWLYYKAAPVPSFDNTISYWIYAHSAQYPIIPAGFCLFGGAMIGHYYWNTQTLIVGLFFLLVGHFFWDQVENVTVNIASSDKTDGP